MEWIDCEENLPSFNQNVLVCDKYNSFVSMGKLTGDEEDPVFELMSIEEIEIDTIVTHWIPLPELPRE